MNPIYILCNSITLVQLRYTKYKLTLFKSCTYFRQTFLTKAWHIFPEALGTLLSRGLCKINKSIPVGHITKKFKKTRYNHCIPMSIFDCVWPAPRMGGLVVKYDFSFYEVLRNVSFGNWFIDIAHVKVQFFRLHKIYIILRLFRKVCLKYNFWTMWTYLNKIQ